MGTETRQPGLNASPVFVVGGPRSGTTLMAKILDRHQQVFSPGESHYFEDIWARRKEIGDLQDQAALSLAVARLLTLFGRYNFPQTQSMVDAVVDKETLVEQTRALGEDYGALYYAFMSSLAGNVGKTRFCDDTPKHLYYLHTVLSFFPNAKVIGCMRDPRDFLCSYKNYWMKKTVAQERKRLKTLYNPVITSLLWRSSSNSLLKHVNQCCRGKVLLVQYEELVQDPPEQVGRVCRFLGLDYSDELIGVETHNSSFEPSSSGIFTTSVGRWRTYLSPEEIWWAQTLGKDNMRLLGYEMEAVSPSKRALLLLLMKTPLALAKALYVNTRRRGPLFGYMLRRLSTLLSG